jgi:hypothetical protein
MMDLEQNIECWKLNQRNIIVPETESSRIAVLFDQSSVEWWLLTSRKELEEKVENLEVEFLMQFHVIYKWDFCSGIFWPKIINFQNYHWIKINKKSYFF